MIYSGEDTLSVKKPHLKFYFDIFVHSKDIRVLIFFHFFDNARLFTVTVDSFCKMYSPDHKKFRSVGILKLPCIVLELKIFIFTYF